MKPLLMPFVALAFVLLESNGCEPAPPPPAPLAATVTIPLDENATPPVVKHGDEMYFDPPPYVSVGGEYWVRFKGVDPCVSSSPQGGHTRNKAHRGTADAANKNHAHCSVNSSSSDDTAYIYTWTPDPEPDVSVVPYNAIVCRHC